MKKPITKIKLSNIKSQIEKATKEKEKFDAIILFKLPKKIKEDLKEYALSRNVSVSDIIRYSLQSLEIKENNLDSLMIKELNLIGINVNQIARYVNQANTNGEDINSNEIFLKLEKISMQLEKINKKVQGE